MNNTLSYLLLCIYATVMIKPVLPTITDSFAHILNYSEHIATVHYHNGNQHVHLEYIEAAKKDSQQDTPYPGGFKNTGNSNEHIMFDISPDILTVKAPHDYLKSLVPFLALVPLPDNFRPPVASFA